MGYFFGILGLAILAYEVYVSGGGVMQGQGTNFQSPSAIADYARNAGFSSSALITAIAVALAESGGNASAYNPEIAAGAPEGKGSFGLWQIYLNAHPEFEGDDLYDPQVNANAAYQVWQNAGGSFLPWSTFKAGLSQAHLDTADEVAQVDTGGFYYG